MTIDVSLDAHGNIVVPADDLPRRIAGRLFDVARRDAAEREPSARGNPVMSFVHMAHLERTFHADRADHCRYGEVFACIAIALFKAEPDLVRFSISEKGGISYVSRTPGYVLPEASRDAVRLFVPAGGMLEFSAAISDD